MAKKDEEYQFNESESPLSYTTGPSRPQKDKDFQARSRRRGLIFMIGLSVVFWGGYKLYEIISSYIKHAAAAHPPQPHAVAHPPLQPTALPTTPLPPPPSSLPTPQTREIAAEKARLNTLEKQIVNLQSTLSDINTKLNDLSSQLTNLSAQVNKAPPPPPPPPKKKAPRQPRRHAKVVCHRNLGCYRSCVPYSYQLEAALPGRAWIMRSDGTNLTVALGEKLDCMGTVIAIDPNIGVVQMSSGATIKYRS